MRVLILLALAVYVSGYLVPGASRVRGDTALGLWGKKKEVPPPPPPAPPAKKGMFSFSKKVPEPEPEPVAAPKKGRFSFGRKVPEPEPEPVVAPKKKTIFNAFAKQDKEEVYDPEDKEQDVAYKARRVARFMTAPWVFNSWEDTEENARKTVKIKSPPSERERKYAALARGELSQDEVDSIRTNPY